jgi:hypothetical protein
LVALVAFVALVALVAFVALVALVAFVALIAFVALAALAAVAALAAFVALSALVAEGTRPRRDSRMSAPVKAFFFTLADVTALFLSCFVPTLFLGRLTAA